MIIRSKDSAWVIPGDDDILHKSFEKKKNEKDFFFQWNFVTFIVKQARIFNLKNLITQVLNCRFKFSTSLWHNIVQLSAYIMMKVKKFSNLIPI